MSRVVVHVQSVNLPDPFGICDDTLELRYYESSYSVSKCRLECQADSLNARCGCKDAHMPGTLYTQVILTTVSI